MTEMGHTSIFAKVRCLINPSHPPFPVITNRLLDFSFGIHHKRAVAYHWFVKRYAREHQHIGSGCCGQPHRGAGS